MFLVVGLAIAGVIGIAAAFYFSLRPGNGGDKRLRSVDAGRAGTDRRPGSSAGTARRDRANNAPHAANGGRAANTVRGADASSRNYQAEAGAGPNPALDFGDPVLVGGRRGGQGTSADNPQAAGPTPRGWPRSCRTSPGHVGAWASAREPTSMKSCGRRSRSVASATSSSGTT